MIGPTVAIPIHWGTFALAVGAGRGLRPARAGIRRAGGGACARRSRCECWRPGSQPSSRPGAFRGGWDAKPTIYRAFTSNPPHGRRRGRQLPSRSGDRGERLAAVEHGDHVVGDQPRHRVARGSRWPSRRAGAAPCWATSRSSDGTLGSPSNTSSPAAAGRPSRSAPISACVSTTAPRLVLTRIDPGFISARVCALIRCLALSVNATCRLTKSDHREQLVEIQPLGRAHRSRTSATSA